METKSVKKFKIMSVQDQREQDKVKKARIKEQYKKKSKTNVDTKPEQVI